MTTRGPNTPAMPTAPKSASTFSGVESLEKRQMFTAQLGINVNDFGQNTYKDVVQMLSDSGTKAVRLWYGFDDYSVRTTYRIATLAQKFHHDGFKVTLSVNPRKGRHGSAAETRGFFEFLATQPGMTNSVDLWELGNEPDSEKYWRGTLPEFVSDYIAPASKVLHNLGESVVSGGVSWNPQDIKTMVDAGLLKYVDYVGYHPYRNSVGQLKSAISEIKSYVGDTPLVATEWNVRGHEKDDDKKAWAAEIKDFWAVIRENFAVAHYFAAVTQDSMAGPAGVLTQSGKHNNPFYGAYMSLQDADQETPPPTSTDGGSDSSGGSGDDEKPTATDGDSDGTTPTGSKASKPTKSNSGTKTTTGSKSGTKTPTKTSGGTKTGGTKTGGTKTTTPVATPAPAPKPVIPPLVGGLSLVNAKRDRVVKPYAVLSGSMVLDLATTGTAFLSVLASTNKKVASVKFTLNGQTVVDSSGPFTLFGESGADLIGGSFLPNQSYVLSVQGFSGPKATGTATAVTSVVLNVIDSSNNTDRASAAAAIAAAKRKAAADAKRHRYDPVTTLPGL